MIVHIHKGVSRSDTGKLRSHPITQKHKDKKVMQYHNASLKVKSKIPLIGKTKRTPVKKQKYEKAVCNIDSEGFIRIDLTNTKHKGVRVKFIRREGRTKRTVGLEIEK